MKKIFLSLLILLGSALIIVDRVGAQNCCAGATGRCAYLCLTGCSCTICSPCNCGSGYYECNNSSGCCRNGTPAPTEVPPCNCDTWTSLYCGTGSNGCNVGQMRQECTAGCKDGDFRCTTDNNCNYVDITIQGRKVVEPGGIDTNPTISPLNVCRNSPAACLTTNPYYFASYRIQPPPSARGVSTRTVSVGATPVGYNYLGYTLCYNEFGCHEYPTNPPIAASSATIDDFDASTTNFTSADPYHYASLYWHYCQIPTAPVINTPTTNCGSVTLSWSAVAGAVNYDVYQTGGSIVAANVAGTTTTLSGATVQCLTGRQYWVRARNGCGSVSANSNVTASVYPNCAPLAPSNVTGVSNVPGEITVSWQDNSGDETGFNVNRTPAGFSTSVGANVTSTTDATAALGVPYQYAVIAVNSNNPAACQSTTAPPSIAVASYDSWFQVEGGDVVTAGGELSSPVPQPQYLDAAAMDLAGMSYSQTLGSTLTTSNINTPGWWVPITDLTSWAAVMARHENRYDRMYNRVTARMTSPPYLVGATLNAAGMNAAISAAQSQGKVLNGVTILERKGNLSFNTGPINIGNSRVLLFVSETLPDLGDVNIATPIQVGANGVFSVISQNNISIDPTVGEGNTDNRDNRNIAAVSPAHIMGVYFAENTFTTGGGVRQLKIEGSITGIGGVSLTRDNVGIYPAEYIKFSPSYIKLLRDVGLRRKVIREQLP